MTPKEVLEFAAKNEVKQFDLRFTDIPGLQHHISYPIGALDEGSFEDGFGIDGSSIRGWAAINESDMLLIPDPATAFIDPFTSIKTLIMTGDVIDPITRQHYDRDPRWIARKAELYLQERRRRRHRLLRRRSRVLHLRQRPLRSEPAPGFYFIDAEEGRWNSGRAENNLGYRPATRKAISRSRPPIITRTCAPKWSRP